MADHGHRRATIGIVQAGELLRVASQVGHHHPQVAFQSEQHFGQTDPGLVAGSGPRQTDAGLEFIDVAVGGRLGGVL